MLARAPTVPATAAGGATSFPASNKRTQQKPRTICAAGRKSGAGGGAVGQPPSRFSTGANPSGARSVSVSRVGACSTTASSTSSSGCGAGDGGGTGSQHSRSLLLSLGGGYFEAGFRNGQGGAGLAACAAAGGVGGGSVGRDRRHRRALRTNAIVDNPREAPSAPDSDAAAEPLGATQPGPHASDGSCYKQGGCIPFDRLAGNSVNPGYTFIICAYRKQSPEP
jgi:hypothetical protein